MKSCAIVVVLLIYLLSGCSISGDSSAVSGTWYSIDGEACEEWVFESDGILTVGGGTEKAWRYSSGIFSGDKLYINGKQHSMYKSEGEIILCDADGNYTCLYSADSDEYAEYVEDKEKRERVEQAEAECADLLRRYPDNDGWLDITGGVDIVRLADADYIDKSLEAGYFSVSTPQELASVCWYADTADEAMVYITLENDIDLAGYEWQPMGWTDEHAFTGAVFGQGHTIRNMTLSCEDMDNVGFIGWETYCLVSDISFDNAHVSGWSNVGVVSGQAIGGSYSGITVTNSTVDGVYAGSMLGWDANTSKKDCTAEAVVNGEKNDFLSYNDYEKSKIVIENPVTITLAEDYTVTRPAGIEDDWANLGWLVTYNGAQVLHRNAENETSYQYFLRDAGEYTICLTALVSGQYVPISNTVSYTIYY